MKNKEYLTSLSRYGWANFLEELEIRNILIKKNGVYNNKVYNNTFDKANYLLRNCASAIKETIRYV
jgi:hypothetical protein